MGCMWSINMPACSSFYRNESELIVIFNINSNLALLLRPLHFIFNISRDVYVQAKEEEEYEMQAIKTAIKQLKLSSLHKFMIEIKII